MKPSAFRKEIRTVLSMTVLAFALGAGGLAQAKGGTAKPPAKGVVAPFVTPTLPDPVFSVNPLLIHGFDVVGFIQEATLSADNSSCPTVADPWSRPNRPMRGPSAGRRTPWDHATGASAWVPWAVRGRARR